MAARTGSEYIERLAASSPTVQIHGETVTTGIPDHPAFRNVVRTYAHLYDLQHDPRHRDLLTYESPTTGDRVGTSFMVPRTAEDLVKRREMMSTWARVSNGFLGRTGDYLNACLMALSEAGDWFAQADSAFGDNVARLLREGPRGGPPAHPHAHPAPAQPQPAPRRAARRRDLGADRLPGRQRHRRSAAPGCWPPSARSPTSSWSSRPPCCAAGPRTRPTPMRSPSTATRPACASSAASPPTTAAGHFDHPAGLAVRGDGRGGHLRRRQGPVRALLHARPPGAVQRALRPDRRHQPHDPSGDRAHHRQDRVHARPRHPAHRGDRHRAVLTRPGERRRDHHRARGHPRLRPRRRGRRRRSTSTA